MTDVYEKVTLLKRTGQILFAAVVLVAGLEGQTPRKHSAVLTEFSSAIEELIGMVSPAVVQIEVRLRVPVESGADGRAGFFAQQRGSGSGVIVDPAGFILTNAHVVEGSRDIDVSVADASDAASREMHRHYVAKVVGIDKETDLAVLKIEGANLPTLDFRDSDKLKQGQIVFALGSPLGLDNTLTVGYVSALARQLKPEQPMYYIQTDAAINPGNSGGPLLDADGKIAGINTAILSQSGGSEGIGFAIPANIAQRVYGQLKKEGHIHRGTIGVIAQDISPAMSRALGLNRHPGVVITDVMPRGAGEAAGLQADDIVTAIDGRQIHEAREVQAGILQHAIGETIVLDLLRGGVVVKKTVAILERPNSPVALADIVNQTSDLVRELGILALTLDEKVTPILPDTRRLYGVVVAAIPAEYAAVNPGLRPGDVIYELNRVKVRSVAELRTALGGVKAGEPVALLTEHEGTLGYVAFVVE